MLSQAARRLPERALRTNSSRSATYASAVATASTMNVALSSLPRSQRVDLVSRSHLPEVFGHERAVLANPDVREACLVAVGVERKVGTATGLISSNDPYQ